MKQDLDNDITLLIVAIGNLHSSLYDTPRITEDNIRARAAAEARKAFEAIVAELNASIDRLFLKE